MYQLTERDIWCELIVSPFLVKAELHLTKRQIAASQLRQHLPNYVSASQVFNKLEENEHYDLHALWKTAPAQPDTKEPSIWLQWAQMFLNHWGWPGQRSLNSQEHQTVSKSYQSILQNHLRLF